MTDDVLGDQAIDGLTTMQTLRLGELVLESINERLDNGEPVASIAYARQGDLIEVYARDTIEAELDAGGTLMCEARVNLSNAKDANT
ncbi:hypothetical protein [Nesterenkonia xinjiangensis]|uniref:Uncharacterized protein n=1 Tax=Nesterenkonia xinjiangensis TaxID=225327 RepID=A0A7Z0GLS1_9MICC|nr:hypothetical protein [Nesterenkonia xinjiangensis]NYJ78250.1 hypothetical protein [Nesterenkonia xinjiangensis]